MIDEPSRRKPGFTEGRPVVLPDGQEWTFARPRLRLSPRRRPAPGARYRVAVGREGLPDYDRWCAIVLGTSAVPADEYWDARMGAAAEMLLANYDLSDDELDSLLWYVDDGPDGPVNRRWADIDQAILGVLPKPSAGISS